MKLFEGKSANERNKIIAAAVLGVLALGSLFLAFGRGFFTSSAAKVTVTAAATPKAPVATNTAPDAFKMPTQTEQDFDYGTTEVSYNPARMSAPEPGRNIFAFYEPPPPCPTCVPTPKPTEVKTPTPTPTPDYILNGVSPEGVYAGSKSFRMELAGDKFDTEARVYLSQVELPTTFAGPNRLIADVPTGLIAAEGSRQLIVQSTDGKKHSLQVMYNVQAPPKPQFQYIGMIARKRYNNDTAYFLEQGKQTPMSARLNDVVGGRFRLVSVSADETILEDVNLGFRHKLALYRPAPGSVTTNYPSRGGFPGSGGNYVPYNQNNFNNAVPQAIPGIPDNIPRYVPPTNTNQARPPQRPPKKDDDDNSDDNDDDGDGKP